PLLILAVLAMVGGFIGIPQFILGEGEHTEHLNITVAVTSVLAALIGIAIGSYIYSKKRQKDPLPELLGGAYRFVVHKYYLDEFFSGLANIFQNALAKMLFWFDSNVVIQKGVDG